MKRISLLIIVLFASLSLSGCLPETKSPAERSTNSGSGLEAKQGDTTLQGRVVAQGEQTVLVVDGVTHPIDSYTVDFSQYDGQEVTVTGQYSGDTLFVSEIK